MRNIFHLDKNDICISSKLQIITSFIILISYSIEINSNLKIIIMTILLFLISIIYYKNHEFKNSYYILFLALTAASFVFVFFRSVNAVNFSSPMFFEIKLYILSFSISQLLLYLFKGPHKQTKNNPNQGE